MGDPHEKCDMIELDGSTGEGGGQILRSALSLSAITGRPFRIARIRAHRKKPGLMRQHLAAVRAAGAVSGAALEGAEAGSAELTFAPLGPSGPSAGEYHFAVGSAGSACLVMQTVVLPLLLADGPSRAVFEGGTHNPMAPTFNFIDQVWFPILRRMGAKVHGALERHGFYPAGGGRSAIAVAGGADHTPLDLVERATPVRRLASVLVSNLPGHVADRERRVLQEKLGWSEDEVQIRRVEADGPGNEVSIELIGDPVSEVITTHGAIGVRAEVVARRAIDAVRRFQANGAPVGVHLADQLLLPLALAGGGSFRTPGVDPHLTTNAEVIERFLPVKIAVEPQESGATVRVVPNS